MAKISSKLVKDASVIVHFIEIMSQNYYKLFIMKHKVKYGLKYVLKNRVFDQ